MSILMSSDQRGFTLIELLLACSLGLYLMTGLIQVYLAVEKTLTLQDAVILLTENGRFATQFLRQNLLLAGYAACQNGQTVDQDSAILGYQENLPDFLQGKVVPGNDSVLIGRCRSESGKEQFSQHAFIISNTGRKNALGNPVSALYDAPVSGNKTELIPDVTAMKIYYGITDATGEDIVAYLPAKQVKDWRMVRAVEVVFMLSSEQPVLTQPQSYTFDGQTMPPDRFLHREWDIYVALRERQ